MLYFNSFNTAKFFFVSQSAAIVVNPCNLLASRELLADQSHVDGLHSCRRLHFSESKYLSAASATKIDWDQ